MQCIHIVFKHRSQSHRKRGLWRTKGKRVVREDVPFHVYDFVVTFNRNVQRSSESIVIVKLLVTTNNISYRGLARWWLTTDTILFLSSIVRYYDSSRMGDQQRFLATNLWPTYIHIYSILK